LKGIFAGAWISFTQHQNNKQQHSYFITMGFSRSRLAAAAAATLLLLAGFPITSSFSFTPSAVTTLHALSRPKIVQSSWKRPSKLFMSDAAAATADDKDPPLFEAPLKGISRDYGMRLPLYKSDITDGINTQCLAAILFLFFACLAPAVGFGALFGTATNGVSYFAAVFLQFQLLDFISCLSRCSQAIGTMEMVSSTALCGMIYAATSGQPLTIIGSTGPVLAFVAALYKLAESQGLPFLPLYAWTGIWTSGILFLR
jgi:hypothetical protein